MIESLIHTTENNNFYLYDDSQRLSLLIHPEMVRAHEKSAEVDLYYLKKYEYLKKHRFFDKPKPVNFKNLSELMIKESILHIRQIVFEVTDFCNLKCKYCGQGELYNSFDKRNHKRINTSYAKNLLKYVFALKPKNKYNKLIISFYGGEPLLNIDFIKEIVETANQLNSEKEMELVFSMTTNATLVHKHINFLATNNFNLLISLDGNEENHSYRVFKKNDKNSFRKVIMNLDMIQRDFPEYFDESVNFNSVLHNKNSIKDIFEFICTRYHKIPRVSELATNDVNPDKKDIFKEMFINKTRSEAVFQTEESDLLDVAHSELSQFESLTDFLKYYSINFYISNITTLFLDKEEYLPSSTCLPFRKKIYHSVYNRLYPCEKINSKFSLGKVNNDVLMDVPEITRQYNYYYDHLKKVCQYCYAYKYCRVCLFSLEKLDKLGTEEFSCYGFHNQNRFKNKLNNIFSFLEKYPNDFTQILENIIIE